jgi:hypothetical protein
MAKGDGNAPPLPVWKFFRINFRAVVGIHDETIHADATEMSHCVSDDGTSSDLQERLRTPLRQRAKPRPQAGAQDEGGLEPPSFQSNFLLFSPHFLLMDHLQIS